jgi:phospholipid/cholesterol/gamma-HCH transport system substrate-binding protein
VIALNIDRRSAARVQVIVDIDSATPISDKTVAELSLLGVTGLLYIDLLGNAGTKKLAPLVSSESYPVIRSVRSGFDVFLSGVPEVMGRASEVAQRASRLLSDDNLDALSSTIVNLERASRLLPDTVSEAQTLARELRVLSRDLAAVAVALRQTTEQSAPLVSQSISRLSQASENLLSASARVDTLLAESSGGITQFAQQGLPEFESLLRETRATAEEVRGLTRELREEPSSLLYEKKPRGIEVPR